MPTDNKYQKAVPYGMLFNLMFINDVNDVIIIKLTAGIQIVF